MIRKLLFACAAVMLAPHGASAQSATAAGCRPTPPAELVGTAQDLDYVLTDVGNLNVVLVHVFGATTLSDRSCLPDPEQGALSVVVNYGPASSQQTPSAAAREMIFGVHARSHPNRRPADFPAVSVAPTTISDRPGAEALSRDVTMRGASVFRYALVFTFADGAIGLMSASGPADQYDALLPVLRRVGAGLQPRRNAAEIENDLAVAFDGMLERLRGPLIEQALDVCMRGRSRQHVTELAAQHGWPAFQQRTENGETFFVSEAPEADSGKISLIVSEWSQPGGVRVSCIVGGARPFAAAMRARLDARVPGAGEQRMFTVESDRVIAATGSPVRVGAAARLGIARLSNSDTAATIVVETQPLSAP